VHAQVIAVDNVLVRPGDYILADDDGVVVIPMGVAPKIAELAIEYGATTLDS
jgi:regulator of RNase E activity RraA